MADEMQQRVLDEERAGGDVCFRCGYDLRGLGDEVGCPECGLRVGRSRMPTEELRHARPRWLWKLSAGIWMMLMALVGAGVWILTLDTVHRWLRHRYYGPGRSGPSGAIWRWLYDNLSVVGFEIAAGMLLLGAVLVTWREGRRAVDRGDRVRRWAIRLTTAVPLVVLGFIHYSMAGAKWRSPGAEVWAVVLGLCAAFPVLLFFQLRHLARRVLSAHLAEHCAIVGVGVSATLVMWAVLLGGVALAGDPRAEAWLLHARSSIVLVALLLTAVGLFYLWAIYLAVRFAFAFRKARRLAIDAWWRADLARE